METLEDSCPSLSDSFSLYERYVKSFNVVDSFRERSGQRNVFDYGSVNSREAHYSGDIALSVDANTDALPERHLFDPLVHPLKEDNELDRPPPSPSNSIDAASLHSSATTDSYPTEKSDPTDNPLTSEDSKSEHSHFPKPVIITSSITMENSNNAVDSGPLFRDKSSETVFKLPINELSFNGTIKHVKRLKPIVDPITALNSVAHIADINTNAAKLIEDPVQPPEKNFSAIHCSSNSSGSSSKNINCANSLDAASHSTGDSQYEDFYSHKERQESINDEKTLEYSYSSLEGSFDSGVRSPDMFSDDEGDHPKHENFWGFVNELEASDKIKIKKMEELLQGVLPPPSVTMLKTDVTEMLKKYYCFLPAFSEDANTITQGDHSVTPTKLTSYVNLSTYTQLPEILQEITDTGSKSYKNTTTNVESLKNIAEKVLQNMDKNKEIDDIKINAIQNDISDNDIISKSEHFMTTMNADFNKLDNDLSNDDINTKENVKDPVDNISNKNNMCTNLEAQNTPWPDILKCRHNDIYYNITRYSERLEALAARCGERFVGAETECSVSVYSASLRSPTSACKRKALRLKMAQAKSPGRRLSHLARRRQAFCSAATLADKGNTSNAKMVLIDKNFFQHRKLISLGDRKSPRVRRTPGKRTPGRKTPGKKTPAKTPKTRSGGSSRKKNMRRVLIDSGTLTRSQPTRETLKRALFISPENRKSIPQVASTSVPVHAMKSKRALFPSPDRLAETKSSDGTQSDQFMKRKREFEGDEGKSKIAKSLSFGGDSISNAHPSQALARRASEMFAARNMANLDENQRKKLLWAVSEALRIHGWRMQSPGFREKATALARLTRRLLTLPYHNARMNAPKLSTSETFLKIARQYVFAIIKGKSIEECFEEEQQRLAKEANQKVTGYISASAYQQMKPKPSTSFSSRIKENSCDGFKQELQKSGSKNVLQDKLINIDNNSNSSSVGVSSLDKSGIYKSNSMPSFEEAAKMRARRQISFDNVDFPKR